MTSRLVASAFAMALASAASVAIADPAEETEIVINEQILMLL